ncbi:MAG: hypothetical protein ACRD38_04855 [Nitrososphaerales archaeon]
MVHNPRFKKKRSKNGIILVGIIAAVAVSVGYGVVSGAFSSAASKLSEPAHGEKIVMHNHAQLSIEIDGKSVTIPENIGINNDLFKDHTLDKYGMKMPNMPAMPVMAPTHTHDSTGTIHIESTEERDFTLGDFTNVWGVAFTDSCIMDKCNDGSKTVKMFVNGQPSTEFRNLALKDGDKIVIRYD